jgi:phosphate transport system substrate-binding protein
MKKVIVIILALILGACSTKQVIVKPLYFTLETLPVMDGSTVTIPLDEALVATLTEKTIEEVRPYILHNKTHQAYMNLIEGKAQLIFVTSPSEEEIQAAKSAKVDLEIIPITAEAFVFLVNKDNPVESLTLEQVRKIYTGEITNWKEVGGDDVSIRALQRPINSGSQTGFLDLVMKDLTPMSAPQSWILDYMEGLISSVAQYDNAPDAIGYSFYYYVTDMEYNPNVKMLKINGIEANPTNITKATYPIGTAYYSVFRKTEILDSPVRKIVDYILSDQGQQLMENAGYVKIK